MNVVFGLFFPSIAIGSLSDDWLSKTLIYDFSRVPLGVILLLCPSSSAIVSGFLQVPGLSSFRFLATREVLGMSFTSQIGPEILDYLQDLFATIILIHLAGISI